MGKRFALGAGRTGGRFRKQEMRVRVRGWKVRDCLIEREGLYIANRNLV